MHINSSNVIEICVELNKIISKIHLQLQAKLTKLMESLLSAFQWFELLLLLGLIGNTVSSFTPGNIAAVQEDFSQCHSKVDNISTLGDRF